jgi:type IV secretory pathway TraG/TraD family ATPase VirD4
MLYTMVMDLLKSGRHVSLIDPHGDLFNRIRQHLPEQFRDQTIFYDPSSQTEELPGIHYLQHDPTDPFQRSYIFNSLLTIFDNLYNLNVSGGPIFNKYFQAAINLVMLAGGGLLDVIRVFEDSEYRKMLLESNQDKETSEEWNHLTRTSGEWDFPNMSVYITSKMSEFRNNAFIRRILTPGSKQLDFDAILNKGKNLMIRLPVGTLSERGVNLIGQIIFNKFIMVAFSREKMPESQRLDHTLVVDEFHKFTTDAIGKVFAEARKYHLNLVVANQTLAQLDINLQKVLLGNVGSMLFFRPGIIDANIVSPYFEPEFSAQELCSLPNYHCAARISVDKKPSVPFVFETIPGI